MYPIHHASPKGVASGDFLDADLGSTDVGVLNMKYDLCFRIFPGSQRLDIEYRAIGWAYSYVNGL